MWHRSSRCSVCAISAYRRRFSFTDSKAHEASTLPRTRTGKNMAARHRSTRTLERIRTRTTGENGVRTIENTPGTRRGYDAQ
jgi:hypothetical protein